MKRGKHLVGSLMLSALAAGAWHPVMASSYHGQFCLVMTYDAELHREPVTIQEGVLRLGVDNMGDRHMTVSGTLEKSDYDTRPAGGNVELIDGIWRMSLLSTWERGNDIYHLSYVFLDALELDGNFSRMSQRYDPLHPEDVPYSKYVTGDVIGFPCATVTPDSVCYDLHIPPGHLPPPGSCRVWNPALPPGQHPPPRACRALKGHVPVGACLIDEYGIVIEIGW